ncbi:MAG TPA: KpsF/GutQ family sugar-phosphate isomerase [Gemmatales bacterium]|nr:KpsF/GutQ family sugar-phosphate isomerase [Gemmatales bacterium]
MANLTLRPPPDRLRYAQEIIRTEAAALRLVADRLGPSFLQAVDLIFQGVGRVGLTGTGKSADIAQKIAGTLNSTGTRAYVLDATRAVHGDLGMIAPQDVMLALSHSGESEEIVRLLGPLRDLSAAVVGLTSNPNSTLARKADVAIVIGPLSEVCPLGLAPSTSTTAMAAVGDALAFVLSDMRQFGHEDFARFHPAGSLGRKLMKVEAVLRDGDQVRRAAPTDTVRQAFATRTAGRRSGAILILDETERLLGLFTDSDLARLFEQHRDGGLDRPIQEVMTRSPLTVPAGTRLLEAVELMQRHKISELPVVDGVGRALGLLDITDLIGLVPMEQPSVPPLAAVA